MNLEESQLIEKADNMVKVQINYKSGHHYFDGHFDDFKLLPALAQVTKVIELTKTYLDIDLSTCSFPSMKFKKPIRPDTNIIISITKNDKKVNFTFTNKIETYSQGIISL